MSTRCPTSNITPQSQNPVAVLPLILPPFFFSLLSSLSCTIDLVHTTLSLRPSPRPVAFLASPYPSSLSHHLLTPLLEEKASERVDAFEEVNAMDLETFGESTSGGTREGTSIKGDGGRTKEGETFEGKKSEGKEEGSDGEEVAENVVLIVCATTWDADHLVAEGDVMLPGEATLEILGCIPATAATPATTTTTPVAGDGTVAGGDTGDGDGTTSSAVPDSIDGTSGSLPLPMSLPLDSLSDEGVDRTTAPTPISAPAPAPVPVPVPTDAPVVTADEASPPPAAAALVSVDGDGAVAATDATAETAAAAAAAPADTPAESKSKSLVAASPDTAASVEEETSLGLVEASGVEVGSEVGVRVSDEAVKGMEGAEGGGVVDGAVDTAEVSAKDD